MIFRFFGGVALLCNLGDCMILLNCIVSVIIFPMIYGKKNVFQITSPCDNISTVN